MGSHLKTFLLEIIYHFQIHNIRSTYNQLTKLLTADEKVEMNSDKFLEPFESKYSQVPIYSANKI